MMMLLVLLHNEGGKKDYFCIHAGEIIPACPTDTHLACTNNETTYTSDIEGIQHAINI